MTIHDAVSIDDLKQMARRRVPRLFFDYCDGGAGRETALRGNSERFEAIKMLPRGPRDVSQRSLETQLFSKTYAMPLGVAPVGLANLFWPGADVALARAARDARIPYVLSTAASTFIEEVGPETGGFGWFQLYVSKDDAVSDDLLKRAETAGFGVLVVTVDVAMPGKRRRDLRNGFTLPMPMGPRLAIQMLARPAWMLASMGKPLPRIVNLERYAPSTGAQSLAAFMAAQISPSVEMKQIRRIRTLWKGPMIVKGLMHPQDCAALADAGVDGVIVSNHGGRQLDSAPATVDVLPAVVDAVGERMTVMMDGGIRTGEDVAKAVALGAKFVFAARPFLYGMAATGQAAPAITLLRDEIDRALAHLGCPRLGDLDRSFIRPA